jgi:hypothetical protein
MKITFAQRLQMKTSLSLRLGGSTKCRCNLHGRGCSSLAFALPPLLNAAMHELNRLKRRFYCRRGCPRLHSAARRPARLEARVWLLRQRGRVAVLRQVAKLAGRALRRRRLVWNMRRGVLGEALRGVAGASRRHLLHTGVMPAGRGVVGRDGVAGALPGHAVCARRAVARRRARGLIPAVRKVRRWDLRAAMVRAGCTKRGLRLLHRAHGASGDEGLRLGVEGMAVVAPRDGVLALGVIRAEVRR